MRWRFEPEDTCGYCTHVECRVVNRLLSPQARSSRHCQAVSSRFDLVRALCAVAQRSRLCIRVVRRFRLRCFVFLRPLGSLSHRSVELKASKIGARSGAASCLRRRSRQRTINALNTASQQANTPFAVHKRSQNASPSAGLRFGRAAIVSQPINSANRHAAQQ